MKSIVYSSFGGRFSDNPRAIYEEIVRRGIDARHTWVVMNEHLHQFPADVEKVLHESEDKQVAFNTADVFVGNSPTNPFLLPLKADAFYLQTWHGTALKRIYFDEVGAKRDQGLLDQMIAGPKTWNALVTPNHFSTNVMPAAFDYRGDVWEVGYPRNDLINSPDRETIRATVRSALGIEHHERAILYTPTWRDDVVATDGRHSVQLQLDIERFADTLGPDYRLVLRLHYKIAASRADLEHPAVVNASSYPDIAELYLAADAMITDYSSTMFDFAITGKPMIFFAYDLAHYRDQLRGFYFDLLAEAPGPVVQTEGGVFAAIEAIDDDAERYRTAYQAFRQRFCHLDDGKATARVVDRLEAAGLFA